MNYRRLGRSGLKVSLHSLGTMNFAGTGFFEKVGSLGLAETTRLVDVALSDASLSLLSIHAGAAFAGEAQVRGEGILSGGRPGYGLYETAERIVAVHSGHDGVADGPVHERVVHSRDGDRLQDVPVQRREGRWRAGL